MIIMYKCFSLFLILLCALFMTVPLYCTNKCWMTCPVFDVPYYREGFVSPAFYHMETCKWKCNTNPATVAAMLESAHESIVGVVVYIVSRPYRVPLAVGCAFVTKRTVDFFHGVFK